MPQIALTLDLDGLDAETVEAACFEAGALAVTYSDQRDDPVLEPAPGEVRLWPATRLQALFDADDLPPAQLVFPTGDGPLSSVRLIGLASVPSVRSVQLFATTVPFTST